MSELFTTWCNNDLCGNILFQNCTHTDFHFYHGSKSSVPNEVLIQQRKGHYTDLPRPSLLNHPASLPCLLPKVMPGGEGNLDPWVSSCELTQLDSCCSAWVDSCLASMIESGLDELGRGGEGKCLTVKISFFQGPYLKTHSGRGENRVLLKISWSKFFLWVLSIWRRQACLTVGDSVLHTDTWREDSLGFILVAFLIVSQKKYFSKIFIFHFYMLQILSSHYCVLSLKPIIYQIRNIVKHVSYKWNCTRIEVEGVFPYSLSW